MRLMIELAPDPGRDVAEAVRALLTWFEAPETKILSEGVIVVVGRPRILVGEDWEFCWRVTGLELADGDEG